MRAISRNYSLYVGGLISAIMLGLALFGPLLAPRDPMESSGVIFVDGVVYGPNPMRALGPFISSEYPLGLDIVGRDILSRLLWAVRPTLLLCAAIALARLAIGVCLGLLAGWFGGRLAYLIDGLISVSVAIPLLIVAIAVLTALNTWPPLTVFVLALTLTAWCDTAALVKSRTQAVLQLPFIESARAIGRRSGGLLWHHVLPQLWSIIPMLIAFELSAALLVVSELGYLGYFIGGGFLYQDSVSDFDVQYLQTGGYPELGQMLSQFFLQLYRTPWASISAGSLTVLALVGFTLLGEGLRRGMDVTRPRPAWWRLLFQRRGPKPNEQPVFAPSRRNV
ncbi:MAG: ABC transporter permease [Chloroflexi bacterium]|nr:ABC transporter permease [Chloroflexota bacterium]